MSIKIYEVITQVNQYNKFYFKRVKLIKSIIYMKKMKITSKFVMVQ